MGAARLLGDSFETCELVDERAGSMVWVSARRGGMAVRFAWRGTEIFYLDPETYRDPAQKVRGGMPLLFPICGPLQDGSYTVNGRSYSMPQHGLARQSPWSLVDRGTSPAPFVRLELSASPETMASYPWDFRLLFTYYLSYTTLRLEQEFQNRSATPMPIHVGVHPYFLAPDKARLRFEIPSTTFQDTESGTEGTFTGFDFERPVIDWIFLGVQERQAAIIDPGRNLRVQLNWAPAYRYLVFWTVKGKEFVCLEPWSARRFAMNTGTDLLQVEPGQSLRTWVSIAASPA